MWRTVSRPRPASVLTPLAPYGTRDAPAVVPRQLLSSCRAFHWAQQQAAGYVSLLPSVRGHGTGDRVTAMVEAPGWHVVWGVWASVAGFMEGRGVSDGGGQWRGSEWRGSVGPVGPVPGSLGSVMSSCDDEVARSHAAMEKATPSLHRITARMDAICPAPPDGAAADSDA